MFPKPLPDGKVRRGLPRVSGGVFRAFLSAVSLLASSPRTSVGREAWEDFARIAGVELAVIDENTNARQFEKELELSEMYHRLNNRH